MARTSVGIPQRRLIAVLGTHTVESARHVGLDIPPGGESAWAYQAGFKKRNPELSALAHLSGSEVLKMTALAVYTEFQVA